MEKPDSFEDPLKLTLQQYLFGPCSESLLEQLVGEGSPYWFKVQVFIDENRNKKMSDMTSRMRQWAMKIKSGLLDS